MHPHSTVLFFPLLLASLALNLSAAEPSLSEKINQAAVEFEEKQDKEFKPVEASLERWRKTRLQTAVKDINDLMTKAAPADKPSSHLFRRVQPTSIATQFPKAASISCSMAPTTTPARFGAKMETAE